MQIIENIALERYTTFGIHATARRMAVLDHSAQGIAAEVEALRQSGLLSGQYLVIGQGSNMVFTSDYAGTVITLVNGTATITEEDQQQATVVADAGMPFDQLIDYCLHRGLYGIENLSAIPGTVGASAVQNVGAYGTEAKDAILHVEAYNLATGTLQHFTNAQCMFDYRNSYFKQHAGQYLITSVAYRLSKRFAPCLEYKALATLPHSTAAELRQAITDLRWQKLPRPEEYGSAGSFFKNPIVDAAVAERLKQQHPDMPVYGGNKLSAAWLIDHCGWRGRTIGKAGVWPKQALVLYNTGGCTGADVVALSTAIRASVLNTYGIRLEPEALII